MQDAASILAGDARLRAFAGNGTRLVVLLGGGLTLLLTMLVVWAAFVVTSEDGVRTLDTDFRLFWAAGHLFLAGDPLGVFDAARIDAVYRTVAEGWMPWLYPPGYLFVVAPFGLLSYQAAFLAMVLASAVAMALATRPFASDVRPLALGMVLAPAFLPALMIGQNSLIWLAVLLAGLQALRSGRAVLAGALIGCLTLKPQLGLLIPIALLAAGQWQTIIAATATTVLLAVLPTLVVGLEYWILLAERLPDLARRTVEQVRDLDLIVSTFSVLARLGLATPLALSLHWVVTGLAALSVVIFWRSDRIGFDAKVALLMIAMLLSAPYLWYYEAAICATIGLFMVRAGILTTRVPHLVLLALLWTGAGLQAANIFLKVVPVQYLGGFIVIPTLSAAFALCWVHFFRTRAAPDLP